MAEAVDDVVALLRTRRYLVLLILAGVLGAPIAAAAYWYLYLISQLQKWVFQPGYLPKALGFHGEPIWWPLPHRGPGGRAGRAGHPVSAGPGWALTGRRVPDGWAAADL